MILTELPTELQEKILVNITDETKFKFSMFFME